jgi:DNA-binding CsgD family transcriptional regulator
MSRSRLTLAALALLSGRDRHRPLDPATLRAAAAELRSRGLTHRDIAAALSLSEPAVRQLLGGAP